MHEEKRINTYHLVFPEHTYPIPPSMTITTQTPTRCTFTPFTQHNCYTGSRAVVIICFSVCRWPQSKEMSPCMTKLACRCSDGRCVQLKNELSMRAPYYGKYNGFIFLLNGKTYSFMYKTYMSWFVEHLFPKDLITSQKLYTYKN